jgi:fibro-slime domain-containing protein
MWYRFHSKMRSIGLFFATVSTLLGSLSACSASGPDNGSQARGGVGATGAASGSGSIDTSSGQDQDGGAECGSTLAVTYRDFNESHPDFEQPFAGDVVRRGLVATTLGVDRKPVFQGSVGHPALAGSPTAIDPDWNPTQPVIHSAATFEQWYNTSSVNRELPKTLALTESVAGSGLFGYDSSAFFPLGPTEGFGITPKGNDLGMNFLFTTEIHVLFGYIAGQKFTFRGDDDLWIFVNGTLALDLGSMHGPEEGTIDFDLQAAALGIAPGGTYPMDVFHAERHTRGSNFKVTTNIACFVPTTVK